MIRHLFLHATFALLSTLLIGQAATIMTWNSLGFSALSQDRVIYFQTVIDSLQPDILVIQELDETIDADYFHSAVLDSTMGMAPFMNGINSDNALYYNEDIFEAVANIPILTNHRDISQFVMLHLPSGDTLRIFSVHLKSSTGTANQNMRLDEVNALRQVTDSLPQDAYYIVCGDFNIYSANEPAYERLLSEEGSGYLWDPISITGTWNNPNYAQYHTQSSRLTSFGGGASSGMDDRFDLILFSANFQSGDDLSYVPNSTWAVGNDGLHYDNSVNAMPNSSVSQSMADALYNATDHLPLIASIEFHNTASELREDALSRLKVYPNPSQGTITVELPMNLSSALIIMDATGRTVFTEKGAGTCTFDLSILPSGLYFLKVQSGTDERLLKLMIL